MAAVEKPAAVTPCPQVGAKDVIETSQNGKESANESPRESLLEKLRAKAKHYKPWGDMAKALRMAIMEKHHLVDSAERSQLQKCLDMIQKSIKVTSMQSMIERLDTITRQQGLMFTTGPGGQECFISSDMFYVEVLLEPSGTVNDVKISHHGDPLSCPELTQVLLRGDFAEFTKHLEGLASIYQLNADKKQKTKAYLALQALETDLSILSQLQSFMNEPSNLVHKSPVGILQPRKGGHPMKLTFFISPYDLLDVDSQSSIPLTVEAILEKGLGHSVSVCIESSGSHKLQTTSLISVTNTPEGKNLPSFAALSNLNSTMLPASFVLKLPKPFPMAVALVRKIHAVTLIECADTSTTQPLLSLIINQASEGKLSASSDRGLNVTLPDQQHCYYLLSGSPELPGVMVSGVPFTHPTHVPQILVFLRQQLLFNTLVASCVRPSSRQNAEMSHMFEVNTTSISNISISFEHPLDESLATVDLNLSEITSVKCRIYTLNSDISICTDEYASKVMQRCLSIPVTMRAVIRKAQGQRARMSSQGDSYCNALNSSGNTYLTGLPGYGPNPATGSFGDFTPAGKADGYRESEEEPGTLGSLLGGPLPSQSPNMMLMSMLSDVPSASNSPAAPGFPFLGQAKPRNKRKRKATTSSDGRSPKRREDDGGGTDPEEEPFLESEAGQNKAALLNPAEPAGATAEPATDDTASFLRGAGGALFPEEGADPGETNRPPGRKVKRVRSEEAREDIKLEREGSRSQDSGPKNLLPGGDSDKLSRSASPPVSFKIEKSGDSLKISKTESKSGSKPRDSSELRKKMDNKKERKRKRAESVDSGCRQPTVAASPEPLELSQQAFNLTTKPHGSVSPSTSRPPLKKSASSLVSNGKKLAKPLQPAPLSGIKSSTEADNRPPMKSPQKSSPSKPVSSVSGTSYVPSSSPVTKQPPSSPTGTLKLKHLNLPSSTTITPVVAKPSLPSPTSTAPPSITIVPTTSVAGGSNNLNKPPKSRKGCLNAVIAKLTNTVASPLVGPPVPELAGSRPDITLKSCEKRDSPTLGKEVKEGRTPSVEGSAVKEGSGIKLTVTKTSGIYKCSSGKAKMGASSSKGSLSSGPKVKSSQKLSGLPVGVPAKKLPTKSPAKLSPSQGFNPSDSAMPSALPTLVPRVAHNNAGSLKNSPKLAAMSKAGIRPEKKPSDTTKPIVEKEATNLMPPPLHSRTGPKSVEGGQPLSDEAALRMLLGPGESPDDDQWRALKGNAGSEDHLAPKVENGPEVGPVALTVPRVTPEVRTSEDKGPTTAPPLPVSLTKSASAAAAPTGDDDSSPEDGLVIDFAMDSKKVVPPVCHSPPRPLEPVVAPELPARASPALSLSAKSPYFVPSPSLKSPQAGSPPSNHSVSSSLSRPSPCVIDDDLMDEAIVGLGK